MIILSAAIVYKKTRYIKPTGKMNSSKIEKSFKII